jgi:hypothetical protein
VESLLAGEHGVMIGLDGRELIPVPLDEVCGRSRQADPAYYEMAKMLG